jgi:hypothetical protein
MCVAQTSSYQDELLALIRKAQSKGLKVESIVYDETYLKQTGGFAIDSVKLVGARGPFGLGCISAREYIAKWLADRDPELVAQTREARLIWGRGF